MIRLSWLMPRTLLLLSVLAICVTSLRSQSAKSGEKETLMHATGSFDVSLNPQEDKSVEGVNRMLIDKHYYGDLEGTAKGQMLATGSAQSSGVYVAIETFRGTLHGKSGSFSLHHTGIMSKAGPNLSIHVVPDSGTGELSGIAGRMNITIAGGKHTYDFEYTLPNH
ncbi:MAG TPA: DUF3224 domain-containing protein [Candidatus Binatia bacterium]|nr:DUF3224 domain-containing protein [Candidatus Binatia bacterium]